MTIFGRHRFGADDDGAGITIDQLARALQTWVHMSDRSSVTVREAMKAFNTTSAVIREAVNSEAAWVSLSGPDDDPDKQTIELDGE